MNKRLLPIGIQTFREIRERECYYVDKTAYIRRLLNEGKHYFLSRPRRFGKSLFLDTLKEVFEGNEPLFAGLFIHDHWDWSVRHPVLRLELRQRQLQGARLCGDKSDGAIGRGRTSHGCGIGLSHRTGAIRAPVGGPAQPSRPASGGADRRIRQADFRCAWRCRT